MSHHQNQRFIHPRHFVCAECRKQVEIPFLADEHYGYFFDNHRFCTYGCMRTYEKRKDENRKYRTKAQYVAVDIPKKRGDIFTLFDRVHLYLVLRENGVLAEEAAQRCGWKRAHSAAKTVAKYRNDPQYLKYIAKCG